MLTLFLAAEKVWWQYFPERSILQGALVSRPLSRHEVKMTSEEFLNARN